MDEQTDRLMDRQTVRWQGGQTDRLTDCDRGFETALAQSKTCTIIILHERFNQTLKAITCPFMAGISPSDSSPARSIPTTPSSANSWQRETTSNDQSKNKTSELHACQYLINKNLQCPFSAVPPLTELSRITEYFYCSHCSWRGDCSREFLKGTKPGKWFST